MDLQEFIKLKNNNIVAFSVNIESTENRNVVHHLANDWKTRTDYHYDPLSTVMVIRVDNLIVVDIDNANDWAYILKKEGRIEPINCVKERTPNGYHLYFKKPAALKDMKTIVKLKYGGTKRGIDIITGPCTCNMAPSYYYDYKGAYKEYCWINSIHDYAISEMPDWLVELCLANGISSDG